MRAFLQKKAGATYFSDSMVTANIRKHNLEFIFALRGGWHAVISATPCEDGVILLACLGNIADEIEKALPSLKLRPGEHQEFCDILECKGDYRITVLDSESKGFVSGIAKTIEGPLKPHLQILGDPKIHIEAEKLFRKTMAIYYDLQKSSYPSLKALTECFYDR